MSSIFRFKQFSVDQSHCAMKVNTDGVLLGAIASSPHVPQRILDIGAGTGVIALMLAQRFGNASIDAVEIEGSAAATAQLNFRNSPFSDRLSLYPVSFSEFLSSGDGQYDLIVSNPPFFIDSLKSDSKAKETARHTDLYFFENLFREAAGHLSANGSLALILPLDTATAVLPVAYKQGLFSNQMTLVRSYPHSEPHRVILQMSRSETESASNHLIIYEAERVYSEGYQELLRDFLIIF